MRNHVSIFLVPIMVTHSMTVFFRAPMIKVNDKVMIPQEEHPEINFVGLLIGPRGNTLKGMKAQRCLT